ncbi:MAG: hypothetical protein H7243_12695 [Sphingomonadaceae bacterium]|nr:hypothetical protein [Sphingomonadaceae bacterium]
MRAFALVAAAGLMLDLALFAGLISAGTPAGIAALASGTAANALVYFVSVRRIFHCRADFLVGLFGLYLCWQAASVAASAYAVERMVAAGIVPMGAKLLILPVTFPANYVVMSALTARWNNACRNAAA